MNREVFLRPQQDQLINGHIWKFRKPLYGLDDLSQKFCLKFKDTLVSIGMKVMPGDDAFHFMHDEQGDLMSAVLTHMDDFIIA